MGNVPSLFLFVCWGWVVRGVDRDLCFQSHESMLTPILCVELYGRAEALPFRKRIALCANDPTFASRRVGHPVWLVKSGSLHFAPLWSG